jgi:sigma-E factor negative regulatory protein RseB
MLPLAGRAEQDARFWLDRMTTAVESLNYEGTFIFVHDEHLEAMHIVHGRGAHGVKERLMSLTGEAREIIRDKDVLTCIWPQSKIVVVEKSRSQHGIPATLPENVDHLSEYYKLLIVGDDRIAGIDCKRIEIKPKDKYRYGHRLCIANQSGMLLRSAMLDTDGKAIEQVMFTGFRQLKNLSEAQFTPRYADKDYTWHRAEAKESSSNLSPDMAWQIGGLPPGYKLSENIKRPIAASPRPVQHMILTDGLASVSVFIAKPDSIATSTKGKISSGAMHGYTRYINGSQITVVGEVPEMTVQMIGDSIRYIPNHDEEGDR